MKSAALLVELFTEELPPKTLKGLFQPEDAKVEFEPQTVIYPQFFSEYY